MQYIFGLAVTEACRDESVLGKWEKGVRLKWPNDIYVLLGDGDGDRKKVGGILVNTSFQGGVVDVVIGNLLFIISGTDMLKPLSPGCGLNLFTPLPMHSLSDLLSPRHHSLTMERTTAAIMAKFDGMWSTFVNNGGSFDPFMELYLARWLHSSATFLDNP